MRHDTAIPHGLHDEAAATVKDALGAFWSSVFRDQDLVDALLFARVLSAGQLHIDVMEALSLRDHAGSPVFHREHWHPVFVRLSRRNTVSPLVVGMEDTPVMGAQPEDGNVYLPGEVFTVGGNALYSKVNTYPLEGAEGCVRVATALCDSVSAPEHVLAQGRDFTFANGALVIRKEQDPFDSGGYRVVEDEDDRIAVLWACDAEFDRDNVSDFVGYPLGIHAPSTEASSKMLSALWDAVTGGLTPVTLNKVLGAVFDVPVVERATMVESVVVDGSDKLVATADAVYRIAADRLDSAERSGRIKAGAELSAGSFLTDEVDVSWGLSADDVSALLAEGKLGSIALPPGSVAGVDATVVLESRASALEAGGWFKLSSADSAESPFWRAVMARTTEAGRAEAFAALSGGGDTVDPMATVGAVVLANLILVRTSRSPVVGVCVAPVLRFLHQLVPAFASLLVVQDVQASGPEYTMAAGVDAVTAAAVVPVRTNLFDIRGWRDSYSFGPATAGMSVTADAGLGTVTMVREGYTGTAVYTRHDSVRNTSPANMFTAKYYGAPVPASTVLTVSAHVSMSGSHSAYVYFWFYDAEGTYIPESGYVHVAYRTGEGEISRSTESPGNAVYIVVAFGTTAPDGVLVTFTNVEITPTADNPRDYVELFDMQAWCASPRSAAATGAYTAPDVVTVVADGEARSVTMTRQSGGSSNPSVYTWHTSAFVPNGTMHFMRATPGVPLSVSCHVVIGSSGSATCTATLRFYDAAGAYLGSGYALAGASGDASATVDPPQGAVYVMMMFSTSAGVGVPVTFSDISVRVPASGGIGISAEDHVACTFVPVAATEV